MALDDKVTGIGAMPVTLLAKSVVSIKLLVWPASQQRSDPSGGGCRRDQ